MRYAAPPTGSNRWQAPKTPDANRGQILQADQWPTRCPQSPQAPVPPKYNSTGSEDCLFLSVFARPDAQNLPVFVWIHGGGYGAGQGNQETYNLMNHTGNGFVSVVIQYRLGAFGFLSSDEVARNGAVNGGLLDQNFALRWVQKYIHLFGGDPSRVTISGESAGGGSVMLQAMAYGGTLGDSLFQNVRNILQNRKKARSNFLQIIASSPYLPVQYGYADWQPSQAYYAFAQAAGCFPGRAYGNTSTTIFQCLQAADTKVLQNASVTVSGSGTWGTWGFLPVTDGEFVRYLPSEQLPTGRTNGRRVLSGNNANEGVPFTIQNIRTETDFTNWVKSSYPLLTPTDVNDILEYVYPSSSDPTDPSDPRFATTGTGTPTAVNESSFGTGQQQRANNLYSETTFVCASLWLAEAFTFPGYEAYKYQFSVPASQHGADISAEGLLPILPDESPEFRTAFTDIWGNFITKNDPHISDSLANGNGSTAANGASSWPMYQGGPGGMMLNLNETGGVPFSAHAVQTTPNATENMEPGLMNDISVVNAWSWEGGRGARCEFWKGRGPRVPE
ncbi:MAG: hypothetical protein Q9227_008349 [Pyrenula ochraceoflavens]